MTPLPIMDILVSAHRQLFANARLALWLAVFPLLGLMVVGAVTFYATIDEMAAFQAVMQGGEVTPERVQALVPHLAAVSLASLLFTIAAQFVISPFAAAWHRVHAAGAVAVAGSRGAGMRFGTAELAYFSRCVGIFGIALVLMFVLSMLGGLLLGPLGLQAIMAPIVMLITGAVALRLALALPATAEGRPIGLREAWALGRGNMTALVGLSTFWAIEMGVLFLIFAQIATVLSADFGSELSRVLFLQFVTAIPLLAMAAVLAGILSEVHGRLRGGARRGGTV